MIAAAEKADKVYGEVINIGSGEEVTIEQVAKEIIELTGSEAGIVFDAGKVRPSKSEVHRLCADASKAKKLLGWKSAIPLKEGLSRTIEWYKEMKIDSHSTRSYV
jgi:nucleoside-diphosphate-sugar epimerase